VDIWSWLTTPAGIEVTHAAVLLVTALAAWLAADARRISKDNAKKLDGHLAELTATVSEATTKDTD